VLWLTKGVNPESRDVGAQSHLALVWKNSVGRPSDASINHVQYGAINIWLI
jgi:hypothetical protein